MACVLSSRDNRRGRTGVVLVVLLVVLHVWGTATLRAHDMWIEPTTFAPKLGELVGARLRVGQDLIGDPLRRDATLIEQFVVEQGKTRTPLVGRQGADPAGLLRVQAPGLLVVGYRSHPSTVEQSPEKFAQYVKEEGLEAIAALHRPRGDVGSVRELFSRCAKSLLLSGPATAGEGDRSLGFTLELVAEQNPYTLATGQELPVRVTYRNQALAGALVVAINRDRPDDRVSARSDAAGRVRFRLPHRGMWMIKAVHMAPAQPGAQADWESFWASLTFELG